MMINRIHIGAFILIGAMISHFTYGQKNTDNFEFQFENKKLKGLIESPVDKEASAIIIIIPGSGKTDFVNGNWYSELRDKFVQAGLTVCFWDKMGCGDSEGEFDNQQLVDNSAQEAIVAIKELKRLNIGGSDKIGLWGISRAGWICPLIINQYPIDFWISVSGTDDLDSYRYLLESNWRLQGNSDSTLQVLLSEWDFGMRALTSDNIDFDTFIANTKNLYDNQFYNSLGGETPSQDEYLEYKEYYRESNFIFDSISGLQIMVEDFSESLKLINCPVLAIFGENDTQVDWRKTMSLYRKTIGDSNSSLLTIKTFENCNHNMQKCRTGELGEDLKNNNWRACDNYYETMINWLTEIKQIP